MSSVNLSNVLSEYQKIEFYADNTQDVNAHFIGVFFDGLYVASDFISEAGNLYIENYILNIGEIKTLNNESLDFIEIETINSLDSVNLSDLYGPIGLINYRKSIRYEIFSPSSMTNIEIQEDIVILGKKKIEDSVFDIIKIEGSVSKLIEASVYDSILKDAVRAMGVHLSQLFYVSRRDLFKVSLRESLYLNHISFDVTPYLHTDSRYVAIITQEVPYTYSTSSMSVDREYIYRDFSFEPVILDLSDFVIGAFKLIGEHEYDYYSPICKMHIAGDMLSDASYSMTRQLFSHNIGGYVSDEITVVRIVAPDGDYRVMSLGDYVESLVEPSVAIYSDGNLSSLNAGVYLFVKWNDYKFLDDYISDAFRFRWYDGTPVDLQPASYVLNKLNIYIVDVGLRDIMAYTSPYITIEAGIEDDSYLNGLYRSMFIYDFDLNPYRLAAWYKADSTITLIGQWNFTNMSLDGLIGDIKKIEDTKYNTIYLSWERRPVNPYSYMVPGVEMPYYYLIRKADNSDFVIISMSSSGGSVLHMHKMGTENKYIKHSYISPSELVLLQASENMENIADPYLAEFSVREVASSRYIKYASVLHNASLGVTYSGSIIEDAKRYLKEREKYTLFFSDYSYNPYQMAEIIVNKNENAVKNNFFDAPTISEYDGVYFIVKNDDILGSDEIIVDFVVNNISRAMRGSDYFIATLISAASISIDSIYTEIIDGCGVGARCGNKIVSGATPVGYVLLDWSLPIFIAKEQDYSVPERHDIELGIVDLNGSEYLLVDVDMPKSLSDIISESSEFIATVGTRYDGLYYEGHLTVGLSSLDGVEHHLASISVAIPDRIYSDVYSDFYLKLTTSYRPSFFDDFYGPDGNLLINKGRINLLPHDDKVKSIWMKMFFPQRADSNFTESTIMDLLISSGEFSKNLSFGYDYIDEVVGGAVRRPKAGNSDIMEIKYKDIKGEGGRDIVHVSDAICGIERSMTYLQYQGFNHMLNYHDKNMKWGNYTSSTKENINSPFLKISNNSVTLPGMLLSDSEALSHSIAESILSHIENLPDIYDWKIEDFKLDKQDLLAYAYDADSLSAIEDSFASSIKFVTSTLGDDIAKRQQEMLEVNMFPQFPERKNDDGFLDRYEVHEYIFVGSKE